MSRLIASFARLFTTACVPQQAQYHTTDSVMRGYLGDTAAAFATNSGLTMVGSFTTDAGTVFQFSGTGPTAIYQPARPTMGAISDPRMASGFRAIGAGMTVPAMAVQARCQVQVMTDRINARGNLDSYRIKEIVFDGACGMVRPNAA